MKQALKIVGVAAVALFLGYFGLMFVMKLISDGMDEEGPCEPWDTICQQSHGH